MQTERPGSMAQPHCCGVPGGSHCGRTNPSAPEADLWGQRSVTRTLASAPVGPPVTTGCIEEQVDSGSLSNCHSSPAPLGALLGEGPGTELLPRDTGVVGSRFPTKGGMRPLSLLDPHHLPLPALTQEFLRCSVSAHLFSTEPGLCSLNP